MSNIIDFNKKLHEKREQETWAITDDMIKDLYEKIKQIEENKTPIEKGIDAAGIELTKHVINAIYELGGDAEDEDLSNDMIFVSMLFTAALTEYFTKEYRESNGEKNTMYEWFDKMTEDTFPV